LAGSEKRIKELKVAFDTPPRWGKGLDWTGYTVHDAANILRRYFNQLPEPIIPLQHYDSFRQPLRGHQAEAVGPIEGQAPSLGGFDPDAAVQVYQRLIKELPSLNRQLLLYILDLLAVFAAKSDVNKMTTSNLAAIFQPGILSHPQHDMSPQDYRLSQDVLIFLIDNQDHFLIGMEGTALDEGTARHVQSGPSTPQARTPTTPSRNTSGIGRSVSAASSAAADSIRKFGGVRRNVSTSSRHSRRSGAVPSPTATAFGTPPGSGVHRSNTVPSKRSPVIRSTAFNPETDPPTPRAEGSRSSESAEPTQHAAPIAQLVRADPVIEQTIAAEQLDEVKPLPEKLPERTVELPRPTPTDIPGAYPLPSPLIAPPSSEGILSPTAAHGTAPQTLAPPNALPRGGHSPLQTPIRERSEFVEGPVDSDSPTGFAPGPNVRTFTQILSKVSPSGEEKREQRRPNKLQKKQRVPSSTNPSARSSTHSLGGGNVGFEGPPSSLPPPIQQHHPGGANQAPQPSAQVPHSVPQHQPGNPKEVLQSNHYDSASSRHSGATLKPSTSPSASFRSHSPATEYSEAEHTEEPPKEEKRSFWRGHRRGESKVTPTPSQTDLTGSVPGADKSMSSFGSGSGRTGRQSLQYDSREDIPPFYGSPDSKDEKKSTFGNWFRQKDRDSKKPWAKSPPESTSDLGAPQPLGRPFAQDSAAVRGKSMDIPRTVPAESSRGSSEATPTGPLSPDQPNQTMQSPANQTVQPPPNQAVLPPTNPSVQHTQDQPVQPGPSQSLQSPPNQSAQFPPSQPDSLF
jgi:hypothetical protein